MTFGLLLGNHQQVILLSDRRLTVNGTLVDDETTKMGVLLCQDARLAFAFTGLAQTGGFDTRSWLLESLYDCGPPECTAFNTLERLRTRATVAFARPPLSNVVAEHRRLSVMFGGYAYYDEPPSCVFAIMTNYQNFQSGVDEDRALSEFKTTYWYEKRPRTDCFELVQRIGRWQVMTREDESSLRAMLKAAKPEIGIIGLAVKLIRDMSMRPVAAGLIGKQLLSITIPRERTQRHRSVYHSTEVKQELRMADVVRVSPDVSVIVKDPRIEVRNGSVPLAVPKVGRNVPCPCGSGEKYKRCHGRTQ